MQVSTSATPSYDADLAVSLLPLAELAAATPDLNNLFLPPGWDKLANIQSSPRSFYYPNVKGFLAKGRVGKETSSSAVMALGIDWADWLRYYINGPMFPAPIASWSGAPVGAEVAILYNMLYNAVRASLWDSLRFLGGMPLRTTGKGLGGPLAQLAALDLRAGNDGPTGQAAPGDIECYAFSTGATANQALADYFGDQVTCHRVTAGTRQNRVDYFPRDSSGAVGCDMGEAIDLPVNLPVFDVPWVERSGAFYQQALGGTPAPPPTQPATVAQPCGFSRSLALSLANLCAVAYQRFQHPNGQTMNISPFQVGVNIKVDGKPFCTLFESPDKVVAAVRGTCTWQEFADYESNSMTRTVALGGQNVSVNTGALTLWATATTPGDATTFADALVAALRTVLNGSDKQLYLTGHGFGGAVASLAAVRIAIAGELTLAGLYTFGAIPTGGPDFAALSASMLPDSAFHVARNADPFPALAGSWSGYRALTEQVAVTGVPPNDDYPFHSIQSYSQLLDPTGF
jgi:hypothetical protein